jgi:hypothetical protein
VTAAACFSSRQLGNVLKGSLPCLSMAGASLFNAKTGLSTSPLSTLANFAPFAVHEDQPSVVEIGLSTRGITDNDLEIEFCTTS